MITFANRKVSQKLQSPLFHLYNWLNAHLPDEQDFQTYDDDEISRLARGPAHVRTSAPSGKMAASSLTQDTAGYINPHTGAREYSNIQEMFSGSSDSEDDKMKE